jgi:hypothetical protein
VDKPGIATGAFKSAGMAASQTEVLAILMDDQPGGLYRVASALESARINISDAYGFIVESKQQAVLVLDTDDAVQVLSLVSGLGLRTLTDDELYGL